MSKKILFVFLSITLLIMLGFVSVDRSAALELKPNKREIAIQKEVLSQILDFRGFLNDSLMTVMQNNLPNEQVLKDRFLKARLLFKRFEWASEYFTADLTKRLNGPPVEEIENADLLDPAQARGIPPMGLQVIEEQLYPEFRVQDTASLTNNIKLLIHNTDYLIAYYRRQEFKDWRILDAAKLEVFRILSLGITGYDASLCLNSMAEAASALKSLKKVLHYYQGSNEQPSLNNLLNEAVGYLNSHLDFNSFDRAHFIRSYGNQISTAIALLEDDLPGEKIKYNRMLNQGVRTLFDSDAFNVDAFSPGPKWHYSPLRSQLGKRLFFDLKLSGTKTRSCGSCHQPRLDYTDGLSKPLELHDSSKVISRNVPTLINAALQSNYFYDLRALTLEDQIVNVIQNPLEMDASMDSVLQYINQDSSYKKLFKLAYPTIKGSITVPAFTNALACYIRNLTLLNSRFDQYMQGDDMALNNEEIQGFNLFMGKAKCATCHFMPLFNGTTPPKYVQTEAEVLGVPSSANDNTLDKDLGYYAVIGVDSYKYAFKIPTVRNITKTGPYMHNGIYNSLEEVMNFYNNGGGKGLGINLSNQSLSTDSLHLSEGEQKAIIAFMGSLESRIRY